ncbi:MAG TPA: ABC transporter ATP-binding protein [Frankiaceae bacterium]|jgi:branched-chain amino acid transport system ATP-binding protein|nr:ABC transporter ATP-binding protein [Frankiaceae bacterium]
MTVALSARGLRAGYGPVEVLHGIDLEVAPGVVTGIVGPNGAGKTTLLSVLAGTIPLRSGQLLWNGKPFGRLRPEQRARRGLVAVPESQGVFSHLSVRENLEVFAGRRPLSPAYDTFPVLRERGAQAAGTLSGGEQRMLALSRALVADARCVIVDEPSLGLAPALTDELYEVVGRIAATGVTVVLADQYEDRVLALAAVVYRLERGEVSFAGEPAELKKTAAG